MAIASAHLAISSGHFVHHRTSSFARVIKQIAKNGLTKKIALSEVPKERRFSVNGGFRSHLQLQYQILSISIWQSLRPSVLSWIIYKLHLFWWSGQLRLSCRSDYPHRQKHEWFNVKCIQKSKQHKMITTLFSQRSNLKAYLNLPA